MAYQASKDYGNGPSAIILRMHSGFAAKQAAKRRHQAEGGTLRGFKLAGHWWPADTGSAAYDYLWCRAAVARLQGLAEAGRWLGRFDGFTDRFHRASAVACQAKSAALLVSLSRHKDGEHELESPGAWLAWRAKPPTAAV